jgi:hypothetical protein
VSHLFFGKSRANADDIDDVALNDANVGQMTPSKRVELLALTLSLFLLLSKALMAGSTNVGKTELKKSAKKQEEMRTPVLRWA